MTQDPFRVLRARQKSAQEALGPEMGFSEGFGQTSYGTQRTFWDFVPFISSARSFKQVEVLEGALDRVSRGVGSDDDRKIVRRFYEENYRSRNWTHTVGRVAAEAIPFAAEFWVGGAALKIAGRGLQAAATASRLARFKNIADKLAAPFKAYNGYTQQLIKQAPVRGWALRGATVQAPGQLVSQYAIGSTVGGSRIRASQYNNYIAHRYDMDVSGMDVAVRVADDSYGMWSNALPAAILDNYIEMFSESSGMALMHLPASIKLSMLGKKATPRTLAALKRKEKGLGSAKLRSFLGIDPDPTYVKYWSDFGFQGLVPEIGEEFVGAISRDTIAAVAPGLADPGNTQHLIENLPAITLGMGLGMFGPATLHSGQNHADMAIARSKMSPEQAEAFRELTKYVQDPAVKRRIGRALLQLDNAVVQGMTAAGAGEVAIDEILEGRWVTSEKVKEAAKERIRVRAQTQNNEPDLTEGSVDKEVLSMLDEIRALPLADKKAGLSPVLDALRGYGVIAEEEAEMLLGEYDRRMKELLKARDKGVLADLLDDLGLQRMKNELIRTQALGFEAQEAQDPGKPGETRAVGGNPALRLGAYRQRERVKQQLENSRQESNDRTWLDDDGLLALQDIVLGMPLTENAEQYGQAALTREALEQRLEYRAYLDLAQNLAERLGPDGIEIRPAANINPPEATRSMLWLRRAGIRSLAFEGAPGAPLAIWDEEYGVLWLDHKKIAARGAQQQLVSPQAFEYGVILHEMVHIHVRRLGAEKGREWLDGIDGWLTNAGLPRDSVQKEMSAHLYKGQSEYARLEESVAFRLQRFGAVLQQEEKEQESLTGWRKWLRFVMDSLYEWAAPRTAMVQSVLRQRDMLDAAGIDTKGLSDPQVMMQLLTVEHVRMLLNVESDVGGVIYDTEEQLQKLLDSVIQDALEVVAPDPEPVPLPEQVAAEESQPEPQAAAEPDAATEAEPQAEAAPEAEPEVELDPALIEVQQEMQFPEPGAIEPVPEDAEVSPATMTAIRQMYKLPQALAAVAELYNVEPESLIDVREGSPRQGKRALVADLQRLLAWNLEIIDLSFEELDDIEQAVNVSIEKGEGNFLQTQEEEQAAPEPAVEEEAPAAEEAQPEPVVEQAAAPEPEAETQQEQRAPIAPPQETDAESQYGWALKIISGGQTGADTAGLVAARDLGLETGGYIGGDLRREGTDGITGEQVTEDFGLTPIEAEGVAGLKERTVANAQAADGTVLFANNPRSPGSRQTLSEAAQQGKPTPIINPNARQLAEWMLANNIHILNVAGNRQGPRFTADANKRVRQTIVDAVRMIAELRGEERAALPVPQAEAEAIIGAEPRPTVELTELPVVGRGRPERARLEELPLPITRQDPEEPQMVRRKNDKKGIGEEEVGRKPVYAEDTLETQDSPYVLNAQEMSAEALERGEEAGIYQDYDDVRAIQLHPNTPNLPREAMMPAAVHVDVAPNDEGEMRPRLGAFAFGEAIEIVNEDEIKQRTYAIYNRLNSEADEAYYLVRIVRAVGVGYVMVEPLDSKIGGLTPQLVVRTDSLYEPSMTASLEGQIPLLYDIEGRLLEWAYDPIESEDLGTFEIRWRASHGERVIDVRQHTLDELPDVVTRAGLELQAAAPGMQQHAALLQRSRQIEAQAEETLSLGEEAARREREGLPPQEPKTLMDSLLKHENRAYVVPTLAALLEQDEGIVREALKIREGRLSWNRAFFKRALRGRRREGSDERITTRETERMEAVADATFKALLEPVKYDLQEFLQTGDVAVLRRTIRELGKRYGKKMYVLHQIRIGRKEGDAEELMARMGDESLRVRILEDIMRLAREVRSQAPTAEQASRAAEVVSGEAVRISLEGREEADEDAEEDDASEERRSQPVAEAAPAYEPAKFTQQETRAIMGRMINLAVAELDRQVQGKPASESVQQPAVSMLQQKGNYQWWVQWQTDALGLAPGELQVLMMASALVPRSSTSYEVPEHRRIFESNREFKYSVLTRLVGVFGPVGIGPRQEQGGFLIEDMHTVPAISAASALDLIDTVFGRKGLSEPDYAYETMIMAPLLANENWEALLDAMQKSRLLAADQETINRMRKAIAQRAELLVQALPDARRADGRGDRAWRKRADARRKGEQLLREAVGDSELMQAVVDVATALRMTVALRSQIQQDLVLAQRTMDMETADALMGAVSQKTAEAVAERLRDQLRVIEAVEDRLGKGQYEAAREILIHDHNYSPALQLSATSAFRKDMPSYLMSDMRDIARQGYDAIIQRRGAGERSVDIVYALDPFAIYDPYKSVPPGYEGEEEVLRQLTDVDVAEELRLETRGYAGMIRHLLLQQARDTETALFIRLSQLFLEFDTYNSAFAEQLRRLASETGNESERGAALLASVLRAVEAENLKPSGSRNYSQSVWVALRDFMATEILLVPGDNGVRILSARTNAEVALEARREDSAQDRDNLIISLAATGEFGEGAWEELWGNIYGAAQQFAVAVDASQMRKGLKLVNLVFDLSLLRTEDKVALGKVMTKRGRQMMMAGEQTLPLSAFNKSRLRQRPKKPKKMLRFMADPFYDEIPVGDNMNNGFVPPDLWDASRMPQGDMPEWSANAFLLAYDDWFRQVNRMQMEANARLAEFDDIIARFVDNEGVTGPARFRRIDLINEALLWAINIRGFLTKPGKAQAKSLGISLDKVKTFDQFWDVFEARYRQQQGRKLEEGEVRLQAFTARHREVFELAKLIDAGKGEWAELGFDEMYQARTGEYGGLAYVIARQARETTELAFRARLIKKRQLYYLNLAWMGQDAQPVYNVDEYGLIEASGAGGPFRQDVGARSLERQIVGVLDGLQRGLRLRRPKATSSWHNSTRVIYEAMFNRAFVEGLKLSGIIVPMREAGTYQGFKRLKHRILRDYQAPEWVARYLNNAMSQYGIRDIENGFYRGYMRLTIAAKHMMLMFGFFHHQAFMRSYLFTVRKQDAFGPMGVKGLVGMAKASLYSYGHAFGFVTQERLETMAKQFSPYAVGMKHIDEFTPELMMGVEEGLTIQRGNEVIGNPAGALYELDDEVEAEAWVKKAFAAIGKLGVSEEMQERGFQFIQNFRRGQRETAAWLFNSMGASLKAAAYMSEFRELQQKNQDRLKADFDGSFMRALARQAAKKVNADFGGLNLRAREGKVSDLFKTGGPRDPRVQMALRALILAPDWTESNLFTVLAALKKENVLAQPEEIDRMTKNVYRHMWLRVGSRALAIQAIINLLLSGVDPDRDLYDMYKEAGFFGKEEGTPSWWKFRWLDINASMFSPTDSKKFVSVFGHFGDPLKWTADIINDGPLAPVERKGSVAMRAVVEAITGADYSGRRFTTLREITGTDYAAGTYQRKTTLADGTVKMPGDSKAGKYAGKLSRFSVKTGSVDLEQVLGGGYLWTQVFKFTPLQVRGMAEYILGQKDGFDLLMEMTGTKYGRTYVKE